MILLYICPTLPSVDPVLETSSVTDLEIETGGADIHPNDMVPLLDTNGNARYHSLVHLRSFSRNPRN